jgi:hypothetical protein
MRYQLKFGLRIVLLSLACCFAFSALAFSQETSGDLNGRVTDSTGAAVSGATLTITDSAKKTVLRTVTTGDEGQFSAPNLPVSIYTVTAEAPNFKKTVQTNVKLDVNQKRTLDVVLEAGNISETVSVTADAVTVNLTTASSSTLISGDQVRELSINNRNFVQLVTLAPGVTNDLDDLVFTGTNNPDTQIVNRTLISVNGARSTQNTFTVDGADVTDRGSNLTIQAYPSVDSIGEFQVQRSLFPAESGRSGGGQINVVTRSGGNEFHGSGFEFIRNEALNANDFATNRNNSLPVDPETGKRKRKPFRYNNYGFTIGGPVYFPNFGEGSGGYVSKLKNTFFFFSEEQRRDKRYPTLSTGNTPGSVPTALMKQGIFPVDICLSASSATNCTSVLPAGMPLSSKVPVSNVAQQYINTIWNKIPNPSNLSNLFLDYPALNIANFRQEIIKIDHSFSEKLNVFYRFEHDKIPTIDADGSIGTRSNLPFVNQMVSDSPGRTHTAQMDYAISPNVIVQGRFAYGYGAIYTHTTGLLAKSVSPIAVNLPYESVRDVVPVLNVGGFASLTGFSNYIDPSSKTNFSGSLTWIHGDHTMKFGAVVSRNMKMENALSGTNQGSFSAFNNTVLSVTSPQSVRAPGIPASSLNTVYQSWANFMQGNNVTFTQSKLDLTIDFRQKSYEWFAQDEWKARRNLTVYYGVRYSYFGAPYDKSGHLSNFDPSLFNPSAAPQVTGAGNRVSGTGNFCNGLIVNAQNYTTGPSAFNCTPTASPYGKYVYQVSKHDFAPRFGIAWDPFGKGTTSVRMGYGIYHEQIPLSSIELQALNPPYQETTTVNLTSLDSPIPAGQPLTVVAAAAPASIRGIQPNFKTPYMQHWSLDMQHQFGSNMVVSVGYYGSKGTHLTGFTEYDDLPLGKALSSQCASNANTLQTPGVVTIPCMTPGTAILGTPVIFDQIRPYRGYRSINMLESRYNSNYHSLQVAATRRFAGASQVNLAYTWSKNLTDNQSSSVSTAPQDANNIRAEYGRAVLDRRHVLSVNYIYELPFFQAQSDLIGKLLGGWQASGIVSYATGLPFTVASSSYDPAGIGFNPALIAGGRPLLLCDPNSGGAQTVDQWFNTTCFAAQTAAGTTGIPNVPGNASRGAVNGPPYAKVDFTMAKNFKFGESVKVQIRAEAFNVLNHTNFRNLSTSRSIANNVSFGSVTSFRDPRVIQLGAKFSF